MAKVQTSIRDWTVPDGRRFVQILSDAGAAALSTDVRSRTAQEIIGRISAYPRCKENRLIVGHEAQCSIADLKDWWETHTFGDAPVTKLKPKPLLRTVKEHLERTGRHWRVHALAELQRFDGPRPNLDEWLQQFGELDCADIGRKIAAKLRVIRTGELPRSAFAIRNADLVGHRQACCYVQDSDVGGSWLEMQAILTHACRIGTVYPIRWDDKKERLVFPHVSVDEFVVYEDGLWSGSEAIRRLRALKTAPPPAPVTLRFGAVTDFGLMVARQAIRSFSLGGFVSIDASASELFSFLKHDVPEALQLGLDMSPEEYSLELHQYVEPFAFSVGEDWNAHEIVSCKRIGEQLVHRWLSHRAAAPPSAEEVERFALGGGQFGSTIVFSRSIPKVCLPLLWLDGPVGLAGKSLIWKPLFVDARRVSDDRLLLSAAVLSTHA